MGNRCGRPTISPAAQELGVALVRAKAAPEEEEQESADERHEESGGVKGRAGRGLRKDAADQTAKDGASDAEQGCHDKAHALHAWHDGAGDEPDDETDDDGPDDVEHKLLPIEVSPVMRLASGERETIRGHCAIGKI